MRSGETSVEVNVDIVMEVCIFMAGEAGAHESGWERRDFRVSKRIEKRRWRGRRVFLFYMQSKSLILICSSFFCCYICTACYNNYKVVGAFTVGRFVVAVVFAVGLAGLSEEP